MPWSGGVFTRLHDWVQDALIGTNILSSTQDEEDDNFAAGLNNCIVKDGTNSPTADLPMDDHKHTTVARPNERNEYNTMGSTQDSHGTYAGISDGDADDFTIGLFPLITSYVEGMSFRFKAHVACNAGATMNVNGIGAAPIFVETIPVIANDIVENGTYSVMYDGTNWQLVASGASAFYIRMPDTPASYTDEEEKLSAVNAAEDGMVFQENYLGSSIRSLQGTDNWQIATLSTGIIPMSTVLNDNLGMVVGGSPGRLQVPVGYAGLYLYRFMVTAMTNGAFDEYLHAYMIKNGVSGTEIAPRQPCWIYGAPETYDWGSVSGCGIISLDEGDYVEIEVRNYDNYTALLAGYWYSVYQRASHLSLEFMGS